MSSIFDFFKTIKMQRYYHFILITTVAMLLTACAQTTLTHTPATPIQLSEAPPIIDRFNAQLGLQHIEHPRIHKSVAKYKKNATIFKHLSSKKKQEIFDYVLSEVEKRDMPAELAMLPLIESSYSPTASNRGQYVGLWQFGARTAKAFGLSVKKGNDGRYNIKDSTNAALDYLQYLNKMFDGDWLLTVAAYNAGEGRILNLMKNNARAGKPTDYWNLKVPPITARYVTDMIGLAAILKDAEKVKFTHLNVKLKPATNLHNMLARRKIQSVLSTQVGLEKATKYYI